MKRCFSFIKLNQLMLLSCVFSLPSALASEHTFSIPGTKSMGMAGAYVAVASDNSAIWYNPAGLNQANDLNALTIEVGDYAVESGQYDNDGREIAPNYSKEQNIKYAAWSKNRLAIAFVQPYQFNSSIYNNDNKGKQDIAVNYSEFKIASSFPLTSFLDIGLGIDLIRQSYNCDTGCNNAETKTAKTVFGYGLNLGLLGNWTIAEQSDHPLLLKAGLNYRTSAQMNNLNVLNYNEDLVPTRPESISVGASLNFPFTIGSTAISTTASLHLESLAYEGLTYPFIHESELIFGSTQQDNTRNAFGLEFKAPINNDIDIAFRTGYAMTSTKSIKYNPGDKNLIDYDVNPNHRGVDSNSFTFGLGIEMSEWLVDLAAESRKLSQNNPNINTSDTLKLFSVSLSYLF